MTKVINKSKLIDCCIFVRNGVSVKQDKTSGGIPITRIETISKGDINQNKVGFAGIDEPDKYKSYFLKEGDVLISHINSVEHLGKTAIYEGIPATLIHGMNLLCIRPNSEIVLPKFLLYFTKSPAFRNQLPKITNKSVNQASFSSSNLKNKILVPIPTLEEQKLIVSILDQVDALRCKRKEAIKLQDEYVKSVFLEMFADPVTNPKGIEQKAVMEMGRVVTGNTPPRANRSNYGNFIEWIKSDNINNDFCIATKAREWLSEEGAKSARIAPANSILVTCIAGSKSCIGNCGVIDRDASFNQQINAIIPHADVDPYFLYVQMKLAKELFQKAATSGMKGLLSKSRFSKVQLLNPDIREQKEFADKFIKCEATKKKMAQQQVEIENQFNSLMQRAFAGALT
ncbi:MAG: restriction endonuclease subunit S [Patescibacteria group bacterium]